MRIEIQDLEPIRELHEQGLYLQAFALAQKLGPMRDWSGSLARVMAGRLGYNLGAPRLARWYVLRAWREDPQDAEVSYYYAMDLFARHGPFAVYARRSKSEFHGRVSDNIAKAGPDARRVVLPVGFVRQHHLTCVPATLAAISRFWSMPADHLQVAEQICYNGTSAYSERNWAEQNGWFVREFCVTWDAAVSLIDHGFPFTLTTVTLSNSHLQAVIGYDSHRGTLLVRDPYQRHTGEILAEALLQAQQSTGPRGMALVPTSERSRFEPIELADANLWDQLHRLDGALVSHQRAAAEEIYRTMQAEALGHRLTIEARLRLAQYDANPAERATAIESLVELFPDDECLQLSRLACLREMVRRDERLATLRTICSKPKASPIFWQQYAQELASDAREHQSAVRLLHRAIRCAPQTAGNYYVLANVYWDQRRFAEALELYRIAVCLDDKEEAFARSYFIAARHFR